eukprot:3444993-Alexandrium_andersonii.AAC.1
MSASLVGSEMCIRDRALSAQRQGHNGGSMLLWAISSGSEQSPALPSEEREATTRRTPKKHLRRTCR